MKKTVIGLPGREPSDLGHIEKVILGERKKLAGPECVFVRVPEVPETPRQLKEFLDELGRQKCGIILVRKNDLTPEHTFGILLANDVCVVRTTNMLEVLAGFTDGKGRFEFWGERVDSETFSKADA